jgi:hypothetical protein
MRVGWRVPLIWPFYVGGTVWQSKPRRRTQAQQLPVYHATLPGWECQHNHRSQRSADVCADRERRHRQQFPHAA